MTANSSSAWRGATFHKSSHSAQDGQCVEVARADAMFGLRDSKNPVGPVLAVAVELGNAFLTAVKREQITDS